MSPGVCYFSCAQTLGLIRIYAGKNAPGFDQWGYKLVIQLGFPGAFRTHKGLGRGFRVAPLERAKRRRKGFFAHTTVAQADRANGLRSVTRAGG
jgi:hypothetical protein